MKFQISSMQVSIIKSENFKIMRHIGYDDDGFILEDINTVRIQSYQDSDSDENPMDIRIENLDELISSLILYRDSNVETSTNETTREDILYGKVIDKVS